MQESVDYYLTALEQSLVDPTVKVDLAEGYKYFYSLVTGIERSELNTKFTFSNAPPAKLAECRLKLRNDHYAFFEKNVNFEYTTIQEFTRRLFNLKKTVELFSTMTKFWQEYVAKVVYKWQTTEEFFISCLTKRINTRFLNDLSTIIQADLKDEQNYAALIGDSFDLLNMASSLSTFKYVDCFSFLNEWANEIMKETPLAMLRAVKKKINHIKERVERYNYFQEETVIAIQKMYEPIVEKIEFESFLYDNASEEIEICATIFHNANQKFGPIISTHIEKQCKDKNVSHLIELNKKYSNLVKDFSFNWLLKGFRSVTILDGFCENISVYISSLFLEKITEEEFEEKIKDAVNLAVYLEEKDVFQKYVSIHFSKRILYKKMMEKEKILITALKQKFGFGFVHFLEIMYKDIDTSSNLHFTKNISPTVITQGAWPTIGLITIPSVLENQTKEFTSLYNTQFPNRRLSFLSAGTAVLKFGKHLLNCNTIQMCILLCFNSGAKTVDAVCEETKMSNQIVERNLSVFVKQSILAEKQKTFQINDAFKSNKIQVSVATAPVQKQSVEEKSETILKIQAERDILLDSTIVRIMKARKKLDYNNIVIETTNNLSSRFKVVPLMVKKRIDSLIEKEYLQEVTGGFEYLA